MRIINYTTVNKKFFYTIKWMRLDLSTKKTFPQNQNPM